MEEPSPPPELPDYVANGIATQPVEKLRLIIEYCEDLIEYKTRDVDPEEIVADKDHVENIEQKSNNVMIVTKKQQCGKDCDGCPHGPYKWRVTPNGDGGYQWKSLGPVENAE